MAIDALEEAREHLAHTPRVNVLSPWRQWSNGEWSLELSTALTAPASVWMPDITHWHLVIAPARHGLLVHFFPDQAAGLAYTHPHQDNNDGLVKDRPWRTGKPCLEVPVSTFSRKHWDEEPQDIVTRIGWRLHRLLAWIDAAAEQRLLAHGDGFELPASRGTCARFPQLGFCETKEGFATWQVTPARSGIADICTVPGSHQTSYIRAFRTFDRKPALDRKPVVVPQWGSWLSTNREVSYGVWVRLDQIPVLPPWQLPGTWQELSERLAQDGVDLPKCIEHFGALMRRYGTQSRGLLLLGFPVSARIGDPVERMHWLAAGGLEISKSHSKRNGFRTIECNHRRWDRAGAKSTSAIEWWKAVNWASDQLRTRGQAEEALRSKRVLVIGAGSLGSAVAHQLVRMGVCDLGLIDDDTLEAGNLSRHQLEMHDLGYAKSDALAAKLNGISPDARVKAFSGDFRSNTKHLEVLRGYDLIVDCSASDDVLNALSRIEWGSAKIFVSLSITWQAEGLLAYGTSGSVFSEIDARAQFERAPVPPADFDRAHREGIGCWSPVFPGGADDIQLWAAVGIKFIRGIVRQPRQEFAYFRQDSAGRIDRVT